MSRRSQRHTSTPLGLAAAALAALSLTACYVVPVDPRTGQAYPIATPPNNDPTMPRPAPVALPAPSGPPQATVLTARLYPLNAQANKAGLITAVVSDNNAGRGSFTMSYLGDALQGEATRVDASYPAFGRIHNEVLGTANRSFNGRRGIANAFGAKGVNAQCEYLITGPTMGTGACQFSDGAKYQMHFGG
jgi:hypothetical protein